MILYIIEVKYEYETEWHPYDFSNGPRLYRSREPAEKALARRRATALGKTEFRIVEYRRVET